MIYRFKLLNNFTRDGLVHGRLVLEFDDAALPHDKYELTIQVWDAFPGLQGDEALLAVRRQVVHCCPRNDHVVINLGLPKTGTASFVCVLSLFFLMCAYLVSLLSMLALRTPWMMSCLAGTTTLHNYFKCGGRTSSHYEVCLELHTIIAMYIKLLEFVHGV